MKLTTTTDGTTTEENTSICALDESMLFLGLVFHSFSLETIWSLLHEGTGVVVAEGTSSIEAGSDDVHLAKYEEEVCLVNGFYTFKIKGNASLELKVEGAHLYSGGDFVSEEVITFMVDKGTMGY